jgi:hypothetical protein
MNSSSTVRKYLFTATLSRTALWSAQGLTDGAFIRQDNFVRITKLPTHVHLTPRSRMLVALPTHWDLAFQRLPLLRILEVSGQKPGPAISYPVQHFTWLISSRPDKPWDRLSLTTLRPIPPISFPVQNLQIPITIDAINPCS